MLEAPTTPGGVVVVATLGLRFALVLQVCNLARTPLPRGLVLPKLLAPVRNGVGRRLARLLQLPGPLPGLQIGGPAAARASSPSRRLHPCLPLALMCSRTVQMYSQKSCG